MAVFRVERNTGYTVMSNHHLRNKELSLKAKGLLSQMLSLPEDWDYTLSGLSYINRESIDAIRTAVWELEKAGYITRRQGRDEKGKMTAIEYTIYEQPQPPELDCPVLENPTADNPTTENPTSENPMQLNKDISRTNLPKKEKSNTDLSITHSTPIHSLNPLPYGEDEAAQPPERKRAERNDAYRVYEEIIKDNIAYDILLQDRSLDRDRLNEIVDLMLETVCTARKKIRIAGDDYPAELVKSKFMKLNSEHIRFVLDCMQENTTKIRNIKQYLKAVLFNAPSTIDSYYTSLVAHDMLYAFIDRVEVHEATGGRTVYRQQNIDIYFNFIGNYYPPVETVSEEERIAAIEAEQLRKKQEKAKRAAEVQKQKKAALMKAVEAGDPEAIAEYERKLALQRERNHRRQQKIKEAREADPAYIAQMEEKERLQREKLLEAERKRTERANRQKKLSRKELKEAAKTDPKAAEEWQALKEKEAVARQRKKEREEERMAADPEYAAMMAERKAEYTRTRTAKRQAEREALVELAKTDEEAAKKLAEMRKYQSQATVRSYQKMKADAEAGDPDAIKRYETTLAKRREEYHRKKGA